MLMNTPREPAILDAAFGLAKGAESGGSHASAKEHLQAQFPDWESNDLLEMYVRASELADACYDAGDKCIAGELSEAKAIESLAEQHPGFSPPTYQQALSWGYFLAR